MIGEKDSYPQCTVIDSCISKDSFLCFREGYPPNSEPPCDSILIGFSSTTYVKLRSTGDADEEHGMLALACSAEM
jgi:hypothetical protein